MVFEAVQNLAVQQAAEDERRRQQAMADILDAEKAQRADAADSPAALYAKATKAHQGISPELAADASDYQQLEASARQRLERRVAPLRVPGPSAGERAQKMLGDVAGLAEPMPGEARPDRISRLEAARERTLGDITGGSQNASRETAPMFYAGGHPAGPAADTGTMPYRGALEGLRGAEVPRAGIRPEFGGTAKDELLSFTNYNPQPGMKRYTSPGGGEQKDLGAPGGSFGTLSGGGGQGGKAGDAVRSDLDRLIGETKAAPLSEREVAQHLDVEQPNWDQYAAEHTPEETQAALQHGIAIGDTDPKVAEVLLGRYQGIAHQATDKTDGFDPKLYREILTGSRPPAPGEAEHQAATGGQVIPKAEAQKAAMLQSVQQGVQDAPGTTLPPQGGPGTPTPQRTPQMGAQAADEVPPPGGEGPGWLRTGVGEAVRFGAPFAGKALGGLAGGILGKSPAAMMAGGAAGGAAFGAGGEAIANYLEGQPIDAKDELVAALLGGAVAPVGKVLGGAGRGAAKAGQGLYDSVQGYRAAPAVARGFQAVHTARQLGQGVAGAGRQLAGQLASEGVPGALQTTIGERGRALLPELTRQLAKRQGPKPTPAELERLLALLGQ